jgi:hypothetical protein
LDRINSRTYAYPFNRAGYDFYADDCRRIAAALTESGRKNPARPEWWAADVDAVLFALARKW